MPTPKAAKATTPARPATSSAAVKKAQKAKVPPPTAQQIKPVTLGKPALAAKPSRAAELKTTKVLENVEKEKKLKLVRDSFTIPKTEYAVIEALKVRAAKLALSSKKSEILRAGIKALAAMPDAAFAAALATVPSLKTGRPKGKKA